MIFGHQINELGEIRLAVPLSCRILYLPSPLEDDVHVCSHL